MPQRRNRVRRQLAAPFVAAVPTGTRTRTRLHVSDQDASVLWQAGTFLGSLAGRDLAVRCAEGRLDPSEQADSKRERKRTMSVQCSSRQAGTITRVSDEQYRMADRNLRKVRDSLRRRVRAIETRVSIPVGEKQGRTRGYATPAERYQKLNRLKSLKADLVRVEQDIAEGKVSVVRGGKDLLRKRGGLNAEQLEEWRPRWEAGRLFLIADGDKVAPWGNYTITWNPDKSWVEVVLPKPLAHLANRPGCRYRLDCEVTFSYRGDEVAAQAATGAVHYEIVPDAGTGRWHLEASWKTNPGPFVSLEELRAGPAVAIDLNDGHIAVAVLRAEGNYIGAPFTIPLDLEGQPAAVRDGRLRAAVTTVIATAKKHGARAVTIEDLDFEEARAEGRERTGNRPSRGKRGKRFRRTISGIPTAKFRNRLVQMTSNVGLSVIVVDPAYSSRWGAEHWLGPLREQHPETTGHHAAALVTGRRGLGHRARRRANGNRPAPEDAGRPAPARARKPPTARPAPRKRVVPPGAWPPRGSKTGLPDRTTVRNQVSQDRAAAPTERYPRSLSDEERYLPCEG